MRKRIILIEDPRVEERITSTAEIRRVERK
jgi:hypothetical protein